MAFFIYGIFSPSGASRLWYNVRTFPQRVTSWISDKKEFLDYDNYKLNLSDVWAKITWEEDTSSVRNSEVDLKDDSQKSEERLEDKSEEKTIQSFSGLNPQFIEVQQLTKKPVSKDTVDVGYSKTDVLWIIGEYIEDNLDDDTDILVTVKYTKDMSDPDKIILETQKKSSNKSHSASKSRISLKNVFGWLRHSKSQTITITSWTAEIKAPKFSDEAERVVDKDTIVIIWEPEEVVDTTASNETTTTAAVTTTNTTATTTTTKTYRGLTQGEIREAAEISNILF